MEDQQEKVGPESVDFFECFQRFRVIYAQIIFPISTASQGGLKKDAAMDLDDPLRTSGNNLTKKFDELRAYSKKTCLAVP